MNFWKQLQHELSQDYTGILMYVIQSEGSSPGRKGFKMFVGESGLLVGSIGGGFMEHKLVEFCKKELSKKDFDPFIKRQIHKANISKDKSGMICSGEQTIAFYKMDNAHIELVNEVIQSVEESKFGILQLDEKAIRFQPKSKQESRFISTIEGEKRWSIKEDLGFKPELHIVGGGHVGLALTKMAHTLDFKIIVYDDRDGLNTMESNENGDTIVIESYEKIGQLITNGTNKYVVLMSFGFRADKLILSQLLDHKFKYLGMMGSLEKVKQLYMELEEEGIPKEKLDGIHSPIGISINSKTPEEIAISIMAEIIRVKNT